MQVVTIHRRSRHQARCVVVFGYYLVGSPVRCIELVSVGVVGFESESSVQRKCSKVVGSNAPRLMPV